MLMSGENLSGRQEPVASVLSGPPANAEEEAYAAQEAKCLEAVCNAYWATMTAESASIRALGQVLESTLRISEPTVNQMESLLFLLPAHLVGQAVAWGFDDADVRLQVCEFIEDSRDELALLFSALDLRRIDKPRVNL